MARRSDLQYFGGDECDILFNSVGFHFEDDKGQWINTKEPGY